MVVNLDVCELPTVSKEVRAQSVGRVDAGRLGAGRRGMAIRIRTYGKFPGGQSVLRLPELLETTRRCYGPTFDVASVKLPETHALDRAIWKDEGQTAPVEGCRLARRGLSNKADQRIARHIVLTQ